MSSRRICETRPGEIWNCLATCLVDSLVARTLAIRRSRVGRIPSQAAKSIRVAATSAGPACLSSTTTSFHSSSSRSYETVGRGFPIVLGRSCTLRGDARCPLPYDPIAAWFPSRSMFSLAFPGLLRSTAPLMQYLRQVAQEGDPPNRSLPNRRNNCCYLGNASRQLCHRTVCGNCRGQPHPQDPLNGARTVIFACVRRAVSRKDR